MSDYSHFAEVYDRLMSDVDYRKRTAYLLKLFEKHDKRPTLLLDIACGTGGFSNEFAKRGIEVIGTDMSEEMLAVARQNSATAGTDVLFLCQKAEELDLYGTVDAAVSCLDAVNYLPPEDMSDFFELLHLFIEQGGLFIFDINTTERLRALDGYTSVDEDEDKLCLWRADFDEEENALFYGMDIFTRRGRLWQRSFEEHIEYAHSPEKLKTQLEEAGFINVELCADGPQHELGRLFIIAENTCGQKR